MSKMLAMVLIAALVFSALPSLISYAVRADPLPAPTISGVDPAEPLTHDGREWLGILGTGFVPDSQVILHSPTIRHPIPEDRTEYRDASRIDVFVGLYAAGTWTAQVVNPDGQPSDEFPFEVKARPTAAIDEYLLNVIDTYISQDLDREDSERKYYRDVWEISPDQYKAWVATIAWGEGMLGSYGAHSSAPVDYFRHRHEDARSHFGFSTGIGPFQIDNIQYPGYTIDAQVMPTLDKLDPMKSVEIVLKFHFGRFGAGSTLNHFSQISPWLAVNPNSAHGRPATYWFAVTATDWEWHMSNKDDDDEPKLIWGDVCSALANNAVHQGVSSYEEDVQFIGRRLWSIAQDSEGSDILTDNAAKKKVVVDGWYPTWKITARHWREGEALFQYYYTTVALDANNRIEVWVWDDLEVESESENRYRHIIVRTYTEDRTRGERPDHWELEDGVRIAGVTLPSRALDPDTAPEPGLDVFMLVDLTGSFRPYLPAFKAQAPDLMAKLQSSYPDTRFGLGMFKDYPISPFGGSGDKAYERLIDLTPEADAVLGIINGLSASGGGDIPESQLVALYQAATGEGQDLSGVGYPGASIPPGQQANFRHGVTKMFILWTDARFHRPGDPGSIPYPGPSFDETVAAILALNPPMVIGISSGTGGLADLRAIAAATNAIAPPGGVDTTGDGVIDIPEGEPLVASIGHSADGIAAAIESLVTASVMLPIASAGGPYTGEVGEAIVFDGSGSYDPDGWIVLYEWDTEGNGVFNLSSPFPMAEYAFAAEFSGVATLRVTDNDGNTAIGTAPVEILPRRATVTISSTVGGNVTTPGEGTFAYDAGTVVDLVAEADEGYRFVNWTGDVDTIADVAASETTITINDHHSITATFAEITRSVETATGTGTAYFTPSDGVIEDLEALPAIPPGAPAGVTFPHGMFSFRVIGLSPGQTITVAIELPQDVPVGTAWWKHDGTGWYSLPNLTDDGDNIMTIELTDGGLGDTDGEADGVITDPGGPGIRQLPSTPPGAGVAYPIWSILLAGVMAVAGLLVLRRRQAQI